MPRKKLNIHDAYIKETFSDRNRAIVFFESFLPSDLLSAIDINSLEVTKETYINAELNEHFSDLVFTVKVPDLKVEANLSLLFEHKSESDRNVNIQIGYYLFGQWMNSISQKKKLKPIIPIIYYQGIRKWNIPNLKDIFADYPTEIKNLLPELQYIYLPLRDLSSDSIGDLRDVMLTIALLTQKIKINPSKILEDVSKIFQLFPPNEQNWNFIEKTIVYIFNQSDIDADGFISAIKEIPDNVKENIMTTYDQLIAKGERIGIQKGEQIGIQKGEQIGIQKGEQIGIQKGEQIGIQKGEFQKSVKVVINAHHAGLPIEMISQISGVSEKQISEILKEKGLVD